MRRPLLVLAVGFALAACVVRGGGGASRVSVLPLNAAPRPMTSRDPSTVEVYTTARPLRPYVEVASFTGRSGVGENDIGDMRYQAGSLGCDALVMTVISTRWDMKSTGTCVVWNDAASLGVMPAEPPPVPAPAPAPPQ